MKLLTSLLVLVDLESSRSILYTEFLMLGHSLRSGPLFEH